MRFNEREDRIEAEIEYFEKDYADCLIHDEIALRDFFCWLEDHLKLSPAIPRDTLQSYIEHWVEHDKVGQEWKAKMVDKIYDREAL